MINSVLLGGRDVSAQWYYESKQPQTQSLKHIPSRLINFRSLGSSSIDSSVEGSQEIIQANKASLEQLYKEFQDIEQSEIDSAAAQLEKSFQRSPTLTRQYVNASTSTIDLPQESTSDNKLSGSFKGLMLLNLGAALFGSNQVVIKTAEAGASPNVISALRFLIASVVFSPKIVQGLKDQNLRRYALELGAWLFGGYQAQAYGLSLTSAAHGAFTGTFTVLIVPMLVGLQGRPISKATWIGGMIALLGVSLLTTSGSEPNIGDAWCILSALLFGVHKWRSEHITAKFEDSLPLVGVQIAVLTLLSSAFCVPQLVDWVSSGGMDHIVESVQSLPWLSLAFMGLATTSLTLWIEMESLKEVSAPLAALIYTSEPLWGALFAYVMLGERWGPMGWVGAALIVSATVYSQLDDLRGNKEKAAAEANLVKAKSQ